MNETTPEQHKLDAYPRHGDLRCRRILHRRRSGVDVGALISLPEDEK